MQEPVTPRTPLMRRPTTRRALLAGAATVAAGGTAAAVVGLTTRTSADSSNGSSLVVPGLAADATLPTDTTTQYRMLWRENQHGGMTLLSRGDSSLIKAPVHRGFSVYSETSIPFSTADGRRVLVLTHEVPCGLICRTTWYSVEE